MQKHRVLFLDVDGVLHAAQRPGSHSASTNEADHFQEAPMKALLEIMRALRMEAKIVLSSNWRHGKRDKVNEALQKRGLPKIWSETPEGRSRIDQIWAWLAKHSGEVEGYAVIDDADLSTEIVGVEIRASRIADHCVRPDCQIGLTTEHITQVIERINMKPRLPKTAEEMGGGASKIWSENDENRVMGGPQEVMVTPSPLQACKGSQRQPQIPGRNGVLAVEIERSQSVAHGVGASKKKKFIEVEVEVIGRRGESKETADKMAGRQLSVRPPLGRSADVESRALFPSAQPHAPMGMQYQPALRYTPRQVPSIFHYQPLVHTPQCSQAAEGIMPQTVRSPSAPLSRLAA